MGHFDELYKLWENYFALTAKGAEYMSRQAFHHVMGGLINTHYYWRGVARLPRVHLLVIEPTRTNKSVVMAACRGLLSIHNSQPNFSKIVPIITSMTPQALAGSTDGKGNLIKGYLEFADYIHFDEAGYFFSRQNRDLKDLIPICNEAMNEPGNVSRTTASRIQASGGNPQITTKTSFFLGTVPSGIDPLLLENGFVQRPVMIFMQFNKDGRVKLVKEHLQQGGVMYQNVDEAKQRLINKFNDITNLQQFYETAKGTRYIGIDIAKLEPAMFKASDEINEQCIKEKFAGEKQTLFEGFYGNTPMFLYCIASQHAILDGKKDMSSEDVRYAAEFLKIHFSNVSEFLSHFFPKSKSANAQRTEKVIQIIQGHNRAYNQTRLLEKLSLLKCQGEWDLGMVSSREFIIELVKIGIIKEEQKGCEKLYFV